MKPIERWTLTTELTTRACCEADLPKLEWFGMFSGDRPIIDHSFERHLRGDNLMFVTELRGFPIAQVWVDVERKKDERVGVLWALRVLPPLQGFGVGTRLVRVAELWLEQHGYDLAELGVEEKNPDARRLYERLGYRCVGEEWQDEEHGGHVREPILVWVLRKELRPQREVAAG